MLPYSKKLFSIFENDGKNAHQNIYQNNDLSSIKSTEPTLEQYNNMQDILLRLYPNY